MIEDGLLDRDTVILACLSYMTENDVHDMMESNEFIDTSEPDWEQWDESEYDVEAMQTDFATGNFSEDNAEDYLHENIVRASIDNGQYKQARKLCESYGLNYSDFKN